MEQKQPFPSSLFCMKKRKVFQVSDFLKWLSSEISSYLCEPLLFLFIDCLSELFAAHLAFWFQTNKMPFFSTWGHYKYWREWWRKLNAENSSVTQFTLHFLLRTQWHNHVLLPLAVKRNSARNQEEGKSRVPGRVLIVLFPHMHARRSFHPLFSKVWPKMRVKRLVIV